MALKDAPIFWSNCFTLTQYGQYVLLHQRITYKNTKSYTNDQWCTYKNKYTNTHIPENDDGIPRNDLLSLRQSHFSLSFFFRSPKILFQFFFLLEEFAVVVFRGKWDTKAWIGWEKELIGVMKKVLKMIWAVDLIPNKGILIFYVVGGPFWIYFFFQINLSN